MRRAAARGMSARVFVWLIVFASVGLVLFQRARREQPPPIHEAAEVTGPVAPVDQDFYRVRVEDIDNGKRHYVRNLIAGPLQFELRFERATGVEADPTLPLRVIVPALAEKRVLDVRIARGAREADFAITGEAVPGQPGATQSAAARYVIPFKAGQRWVLDQGFEGEFSHRDVQSRYALDFAVDEGTPVLASRAGVVMHVRDDFEISGQSRAEFAERSNVVRVLHADGTMAIYAHLSPHSALARIGQAVEVGTPLGLSGNTGYSTGPHLHFAVQRNAGMKLESIVFDMDGVDERDF